MNSEVGVILMKLISVISQADRFLVYCHAILKLKAVYYILTLKISDSILIVSNGVWAVQSES